MVKIADGKESKTVEADELDSALGNLDTATTSKKKNTKIPVDSYNRIVATQSKILAEIYQQVTQKDLTETFISFQLNGIKAINSELEKWLISKGKNLIKEFSKPATVKEARGRINGLNKVRNGINKKFGLQLQTLPQIPESIKDE